MVHNNISSVPSSTRVIPSGLPFEIQRSDEHAVLLLHGYTGYAGNFRYLAEEIVEAGPSVCVPRLPGHATNSADFRRSNAREWVRTAVDSYLDLASRYERVSVVGLSMGALLATLVATQFPVRRLVLLAPAFVVANPFVVLTPLLRYVIGPYRSSEPESYPDDPDREYMSSEYWQYTWPDKVADLYAIMRRARRAIARVSVPTLLIVSKTDASVPVRVRGFVETSIDRSLLTTVVLEESEHVITRGEEKERVAAECAKFLANA
jgi:carboxylesterase